jgi:hypothetical protein
MFMKFLCNRVAHDRDEKGVGRTMFFQTRLPGLSIIGYRFFISDDHALRAQRRDENRS